MPTMTRATAYTDGANMSRTEKHAGSAAVILVHYDGGEHPGLVVEHAAYIGRQTNNIAELMAIEMAVDWMRANLPRAADRIVVTDSEYCQGVLTPDPSKGAGQWRYRAKANAALIERIRAKIVDAGGVTIRHVRGHQGDTFNERADDLAVWCKLHQKPWYADYPFGQPFPAFPPAEGAVP